jgi:hypothetical protein
MRLIPILYGCVHRTSSVTRDALASPQGDPIGQAFGGKVVRAGRIMHGKTSPTRC